MEEDIDSVKEVERRWYFEDHVFCWARMAVGRFKDGDPDSERSNDHEKQENAFES